MANFANPTVGSNYTDFPVEIRDSINAALQQLSTGTHANVPTGAIQFNTTLNRWRKYNGSAYEDLTGTYDLNANVNVNQLNLGDNERIRLGNSQDLQIYHDGSDSFIVDQGSGQLYLRGSASIRLQNHSGSEDYARFVQNGTAELYFDNNKKIETTSSGVTVTGGITATGGMTIDNGTLHVASSNNLVGVGTTSPAENLHIRATSNVGIRLDDSGQSYANIIYNNGSNSNDTLTIAVDEGNTQSNSNMRFRVDASEKMRLGFGGRLGLGTTSADSLLDVVDSAATGIISNTTSTQSSDTNKALKVRNNSTTDTFAVSYRGSGYFAQNVGINKTSPSGKLHISSGNSGDCEFIIEADEDNNNENDTPRILLRQDGGADHTAMETVNNLFKISNSVSGGGIAFSTGNTSPYTNASERGRFTDGGNFALGRTSANERLHVQGSALIEDTSGNSLTVRSTVNNGNDPNILFQKSRGGGTPSIVQSGDDIGRFSFNGYDGNNYEMGASILGEIQGTPADGDMPMRMVFSTRSQGAGAVVGRLVINADGHVDVIGNLDVGAGIDCTGDIIVTDASPAIYLVDNAGSPQNPDYRLQVNGGTFLINDDTNSEIRFQINSVGNIGINAAPRTSGTIVSNTEHFLCIGDSDTGIAQDGDGQFEIWANNQEIANFNTANISFNKLIGIPDTIQHAGDSNTKIRFPANDTFSVETSGSESLRVSSDNRLGIGTTSPDALVHLLGSNVQGGIFIEDASTSGVAPCLHIRGKRSDSNDSFTFGGQIYLSCNRTNDHIDGGKRLGTILFGGNHSNSNTSNERYAAMISGQANSNFNSGTDMPTNLVFYTGSTGRTKGQNNTTAGSERFRLMSTGNLRFGQTSQDTPGLGDTVVGIGFEANGRISGSTSGTEVGLSLNANTNSTQKHFCSFRRNGTQIGSIRQESSGVSFNTTSDRRLKENIVDIKDALLTLLKLKPKEYNWKSDKNKISEHGFIAQDLLEDKLCEYAVAYSEKEDTYGMDYGRLTAITIAAIQELAGKVSDLESKLG